MFSRAARINYETAFAHSDKSIEGKLIQANPNRATGRSFAGWSFRLASRMFLYLVFVALIAGFFIKNREVFVPGEGLGYTLGIVGGCAMLLLLAYPLVKRTRLLRDGHQSSFWFRWHMVLGILGPLLILYHSNFSTGATNSNVALFSMIVVALSGVIGRYIYGRVHNGMYGAKLDVGALLARATRLVSEVEDDVGGASGVLAKALADFGESVLSNNRMRTTTSLMSVMMMPLRVSFARGRILGKVRSSLKANSQKMNWSRAEKHAHFVNARGDVDEFLSAVSRAALMSFWERVFSLWHILHIPLFFLLLVSGVIHVVAVHLY